MNERKEIKYLRIEKEGEKSLLSLTNDIVSIEKPKNLETNYQNLKKSSV